MTAGQQVTASFDMTLNHSTYFMMGVDFIQYDAGKEWHDNVRVSTSVEVTYTDLGPGDYLIVVPPNMDNEECVEQSSLGRRCEYPTRLTGLTYRLRKPYALNTTRVTVDGLVLAANGIQYTETSPQLGQFVLNEEPDGEVWVCYDASGYYAELPPPEVLFLLPVQDRVVGYFGSHESGWGSYYWHGSYYEHFHNGVDFESGIGTPVYAAADGRVGWEDQAAGGLMIHIYHDFHGFRTTYAHLSSRIVEDGDEVLQGQIIGYTGDTGNVTGPHLHWGLVHQGSPENPLLYTTYYPAPVSVNIPPQVE